MKIEVRISISPSNNNFLKKVPNNQEGKKIQSLNCTKEYQEEI